MRQGPRFRRAWRSLTRGRETVPVTTTHVAIRTFGTLHSVLLYSTCFCGRKRKKTRRETRSSGDSPFVGLFPTSQIVGACVQGPSRSSPPRAALALGIGQHRKDTNRTLSLWVKELFSSDRTAPQQSHVDAVDLVQTLVQEKEAVLGCSHLPSEDGRKCAYHHWRKLQSSSTTGPHTFRAMCSNLEDNLPRNEVNE